MYQRTDLPKVKAAGQEVIENWYFSVMAYNGTKPANSPLYKATGQKIQMLTKKKCFLFYHYSPRGDVIAMIDSIG